MEFILGSWILQYKLQKNYKILKFMKTAITVKSLKMNWFILISDSNNIFEKENFNSIGYFFYLIVFDKNLRNVNS